MASKKGLLIVDVQNDFLPGGALGIPGSDILIGVLNSYINLFHNRYPIFASRDWHPAKSRHFKEYGGIWPAHCVQESEGAMFGPGLMLPESAYIVSKGMDEEKDGYSAFEAETVNRVELNELLRRLDVTDLYIGGVATDYCVKSTVLEALTLGFKVHLLVDAIMGVNINEDDADRALAEMYEEGAQKTSLDTIGRI